jgi:hypothetical protein
MKSDMSVTAHFKPLPAVYDITISVEGNGTTNPSPGKHPYEEGSVVHITNQPDPGWMFDCWSGSASGTSPSLDITMDSDMFVIAQFEEAVQSVSSVNIIQGDTTLEEGKNALFTVIILDSVGNELTDRRVFWTSSNQSVAAVSLDGMVKAKSRGTVAITATVNGKSDRAIVTVTWAKVAIYQYSATDPYRFIYSKDPNFGAGWTRGDIAFYAVVDNSPGSVPIYQMWASSPSRQLLSKVGFSGAGWSYGGEAFWTVPDNTPGSIRIYEHVAWDPHRFLYSRADYIGSGWTYEKIAFYALP